MLLSIVIPIRNEILYISSSFESIILVGSEVESEFFFVDGHSNDGTYEWLKQEIKEIKNSRELQGQSPYLINSGFIYNSFDKTIEIGAYYNVQGKTLEVVGICNLPDVYTLPFHNLNLNISKSFGNNLDQSLTFKAENLLNSKRESEYDYYNIETSPFSIYNPGQSFSLGYSIKF